MNLTGCTLRSQVRRKALATGAPLATFAFTITDAPAGKAELLLTEAQTAALPTAEDPLNLDSRSQWDLELVDALGDVRRLLYGTVTVHREVTR